MGKRELIIVGAFAVVAVLAYQITAPPLKDGERSFSLSGMFSSIKREMTANSKSVTVTKAGTVALRAGVTELRLTALRAVPLTVVGERRDDIGYEMSVQSTGPDEATARDYAGRSKLVEDDLGEAQALAIDFPEEGQQTARLTLRVPNRLLIRVENSGKVSVSGVRAVDLRNLAGEVTIVDVTGHVTGSHRSGELTVTRAGTVELGLSSSRAKFSEVAGRIKLTGRNGDCSIVKSKGAVEAMMLNVDLTITEHAGPVQVAGENGTLRIAQPLKELAIDVKRMVVQITMATAVAATVITSDEPVRLSFAEPPRAALDAAATGGGTIQATDFGLTPTGKDGESRLASPIGGGGPRIVLRNARGDIVISLLK